MALSIRHALAAALFLALPFGCRGILDIEEPQFADRVSCVAYCDLIESACADEHRQYQKDACLTLCPTFPRGALGQAGHTLACRVEVLEDIIKTGELVSCDGAGPAGHNACGTKCDVYCDSMEELCPAQFATFKGDCLDECRKIADCGGYFADPDRNDDTLQCRLYHLASASLDRIHCPHTVGIGFCGAPVEKACDTDP